MKERSKIINLKSLENYQPPEVKQRKRNKKEKQKKKEEKQQETILLKLKTGEEVEEGANTSDNRSTNPSSLTVSSNMSDKGTNMAIIYRRRT